MKQTKTVVEQAVYKEVRGKSYMDRLLEKQDAVKRYAEGMLTLPGGKEFGEEILKILRG